MEPRAGQDGQVRSGNRRGEEGEERKERRKGTFDGAARLDLLPSMTVLFNLLSPPLPQPRKTKQPHLAA